MLSGNGLFLEIEFQRRRELLQNAERYRLVQAARESHRRRSYKKRMALRPAGTARRALA
jgi:hypothetical protein